MKIRLLILGLCMAMVVPAFAQQTEVDVTKLLADTKTFIFSNNKNTVKTYIYEEMEGKTTCCGNDRIYLEIKIDPSGYVLQAKTLTGKNDCYKKSAIDIVKNIKWDAKGFKGPKSVYFEIKPEVECAEARTNTYAALPLFNNEVLDENGVPLSYASSTGVSASSASGVSTTPTGVPATPVNPKPSTAVAGGTAGAGTAEPAVADNGGTTKPAVDAGAAGGAGSDVSEPIASATKPGTGAPNTATNTSDNELEKAKTMAKMEKVQQDDEIEKLKKELEQMKELEKQRAEKESEKARREEAAKERERILNLQKEKDARAKREREAARERERTVASNNSGSQGGFRDVDYSDDGGDNGSSGGGYDYSDDRSRGSSRTETDPPPRAKTAAERAREEKARLDRELEDLKRKQQDFDRDERARLADKERTAKDIARLQEQILRKAEEERKATEKEALDQLETQRREADQRKRDMEQAVQRKMDELKRMQMDMDRQLADLKRLEEEAKRKEEEKMQREQEITAEQQIRQQQMEAEIERQKLMAGGGSGATSVRGMTPMPVFTGGGSDSLSGSSVAFLAAQIEQLRRDILGLQNALGGGTTSPVLRSSPSSPRNRTAGAPTTASGEKSAATDKSWSRTKYNKDGVYYPTTASAAPGGDLRPDPSHAGTHENVTIPRVGAPTYAGGNKAMNSLIADKLMAAGICGLAEATFELEVNGQGTVVQHRILSVGTPDMQFQLPAILQGLKFEASNSRFNQSLFSIFKAEITCNSSETPATEMPESTNQ